MFVVNYHNVVAGPLDALDRRSVRIPVDEFRAEMQWIHDHCRPMALAALLDAARDGRSDPRAVAVTFDDGYLGVERHAWPIVRELGMTATIFVVTASIESPGELRRDDELEMAYRLTTKSTLQLSSFGYPDQPLATLEQRRNSMIGAKQVLKGLEDDLRGRAYRRLLVQLGVTPEQCHEAADSEKYRVFGLDGLRRLAGAGWSVGSHTVTHRSLSTLSQDHVIKELVDSRQRLEAWLGAPVTALAYPYGGASHIGADAPRLAREAGYRYALTAQPGAIGPETDWFMVPRVSFGELVEMTRR